MWLILRSIVELAKMLTWRKLVGGFCQAMAGYFLFITLGLYCGLKGRATAI